MRRPGGIRVIAFIIIFLSVSVLGCGPGSTWQLPLPTLTKKPPSAPSALNGQAHSRSQITIIWIDNSDNEDGFKVYRNGVYISSVQANSVTFQDKGLQYSTIYTYSISAYNDVGETRCPTTVQVKTLNPPITVKLDRIGVLNDHDPVPSLGGLGQGPGDIYLYLAISDGKAQPQVIRVPSAGTISLNNNESKQIEQQVFSSDCVGDELKIVAISYESDPAIAGLLRDLFLPALLSYLDGVTGGGASIIATLLQSQPSSDEGTPEGITGESSEDDFVGAIERTWTSANNFGIGSYSDVRSGDLRLWFTISIPGETVATALPSVTSLPPIPAPTPTSTITHSSTLTTTSTPKSTPISVVSYGFSPNPITLGNTVTTSISISGGNAGAYTLSVWKDISLATDQLITSFAISYDGISASKNFSFTPSATGSYHLALGLHSTTLWSQPNDGSRLKVTVPPTKTAFSVTSYGFSPSTTTVGHAVTGSIAIAGGSAGTYTLRLFKDIEFWPDAVVATYSFSHDSNSTSKSYSITPASTGSYHFDLQYSGNTIWSQPNDSSRLRVR